eukprot:17102_1
MAEQEEEKNHETYVVNLFIKPISVRVKSNETHVTKQYTKTYNEINDRIKKYGGGGIDFSVPEVGSLGVRGDGGTETEKNIKQLQEDYTELYNVLNTAGFVYIPPLASSHFTTQQSIKFVTIYVNGKLMADNMNSDDEEYVVDGDGKRLITNEKSVIAPYYDQGDIFSSAYATGMIATLTKLKDLYYYAQSARIDESKGDKEDNKIIKAKTLEGLVRVGIDFVGLNLTASESLRVVSGRWCNKSVRRLYETGKAIENIPRSEISDTLKEISTQALEIAQNWNILAGYYTSMKSEIYNTQIALLDDEKDAKELMEELKSDMDNNISNEKSVSESYKWKIGLTSLSVLVIEPFGLIGFVVGASILGAQWDQLKNKISQDKRTLNKMIETKKTLVETIEKLDSLAESLQEMVRFCNKMNFYFSKQADEFQTWGEDQQELASGIDDSWKKWSPEQVAEWISNLEGGKFSQYKDALTQKFKDDGIGGSEFGDINELLLKQLVGIPKEDGEVIEYNIQQLVQKG